MTGIELLRKYAETMPTRGGCSQLFDALDKECDDFGSCNDCHRFVCETIADQIERETERTCHMEFRKRGSIYDVFYFDCCCEEYTENRTDQYASGISGHVCPYCGAKVVE